MPRARPVRERLLLVLPHAELHDYRCTVCGESLGSREVRTPPRPMMAALPPPPRAARAAAAEERRRCPPQPESARPAAAAAPGWLTSASRWARPAFSKDQPARPLRELTAIIGPNAPARPRCSAPCGGIPHAGRYEYVRRMDRPLRLPRSVTSRSNCNSIGRRRPPLRTCSPRRWPAAALDRPVTRPPGGDPPSAGRGGCRRPAGTELGRLSCGSSSASSWRWRCNLAGLLLLDEPIAAWIRPALSFFTGPFRNCE
jgi:hypothetical protein